ncbi:MAG TPA: hypothetical protein VM012_14195 [Flavitalea sp.]|nr:hypothetical protein [Flavitalea sp.]
MILIILACILAASFFSSPRHFPFVLVTYFVFYDMFDGFYKDDKMYAVIRYIIPVLFIFIYFIKYDLLKKIESIFIIVIAYLLILWIFNPGDEIVTARNALAVLITYLMIPIGKHVGETLNFIRELEKYNRLLLIAIPVYIIYANIANIGGFYSDSFSTGFLITSRMYIVPIVVFLAIHYALTNKNKGWFIKCVDLTFILINISMLLINTRRTTFGMLAAAIIIYTFFNRKLFFKMVMLVFLLASALVVSYPLYEARLTAQLEKRARIQDVDTYEEEGRYLETLYLIDYHRKKGDLRELLFGIQLFDTFDFGIRYFGRDRPIHSDINMLFFSTGIVGLFLFFRLYTYYFLAKNFLVPKHLRQLYYPMLFMFLIVLIPGRFIATLTYAPFLMLFLSTLKFSYAYRDTIEENSMVPAL